MCYLALPAVIHGPVKERCKQGQFALPFSYKLCWLSFVFFSFRAQTGDIPRAWLLQLFKALLPVGPG